MGLPLFAKEGAGGSLLLEANGTFTRERIRAITEWLGKPGIHPFNCAVYGLKDILDHEGVVRSVEELAVLTVSVDLVSDVIKVGDPKLKTSLYALDKVAQALGVSYQSVKITPANVVKLPTPFLVHLQDEHFVTVTAVKNDMVYFNDIGVAGSSPAQEFIQKFDGFVYIKDVKAAGVAF